MIEKVDIAIVGAGMVGLTCALAIAKESDLTVAVIDVAEQPVKIQSDDAPHNRVSAINKAATCAFEKLDVWQAIAEQRIAPYQGMQVWDKDNIGRIEFHAADVNETDLGHIIENDVIQAALWQNANTHQQIKVINGPSAELKQIDSELGQNLLVLQSGQLIQAKWVIAADGANSKLRQLMDMPLTFSDYGQKAIVATIKTELPHQGVARQVFTPDGPLAFLPLADKHLCSIVFSQTADKADALMASDDAAFNKVLSATFDGSMGRVELVSKRQTFPLMMRYARDFIKQGVILIGDAAHTIHPLAGQGANLGLMDALAVAEYFTEQAKANTDMAELDELGLKQVMRWRKSDAFDRIAAMQAFHNGFSNEIAPIKVLRGLALCVADKLTPLKNTLIKEAMGINGRLPALAKNKL
ncbi:FAD-dependent monooxygenase [Catenovulum sp. SM1970]|uniref:FAD-dependent monooxygenase n=1 Tax=Marinifaba aquimaris TaxID=2741323 RepID=UPI0015749513|nr:FAD-dependent monooxygenase [Marinifaba aquimaris]NTS77181.1 FAD-dependent monooxygenase [Marinifaba aquimaris]